MPTRTCEDTCRVAADVIRIGLDDAGKLAACPQDDADLERRLLLDRALQAFREIALSACGREHDVPLCR
jgi:hypothetical protein